MKRKLSIIVVNYNGIKWLDIFFGSLEKQTYKNFEIIFVDNNSADRSIEYVKENYPDVKIVELEENLGFAGGNNKGFEVAKGELILFLNNDTFFGKNFLKRFVRAFNDDNISIAQSKLVLADERTIDSCGSFWTDTTFMYYYGNGKDASLEIYNKSFKVFSAKGASFMVRRKVIEEIGLFDGDFWNYYEETDFCHRAWLAGYESWYCPEAVCFHAMGGTSVVFPNDYIQFHNFKNKLNSFLKNLALKYLLLYVPIFLFLNALISMAWLMQGKVKHSISLFRAFAWNVVNLPQTITKRRQVQSKRKMSDQELFMDIKINPKISYFTHLFNNTMDSYSDFEINNHKKRIS